MKMNSRLFIAAFTGMLLAGCVHFRGNWISYEDRIAAFTRDYVSGRISFRRYQDLCHVVNAERQKKLNAIASHSESESRTACDAATSTRDDEREAEKRELQEHQRRRAIGEAYEKAHPSPPPKAR